MGVDPNQTKVGLINAGQSPIIEKEMEEIIRKEVDAGRLQATTDAKAAMQEAEISFVCVGTPSKSNGDLDLSHVRRVSRQTWIIFIPWLFEAQCCQAPCAP
jgi:GDP-mannose 6-dehydrogenase